jgi:hypothetical protein
LSAPELPIGVGRDLRQQSVEKHPPAHTGYDDDTEAAEELLSHLRAIYWTAGLALLVTRPGELAGLG